MGRPERDNWMRAFLRDEAEAQTRILVGLRGRLERGMEAAEKANPKSTKPPSREWVRAARLYLDGYRHLAQLELDTAKLALMAERKPMTEDEVARGMAELEVQAIAAAPDEKLVAELERRRALQLPAPASDPD